MRNEIIKLNSDMETYIAEIRTAISNKKTYEDPGYDIDKVHKKIEHYKKKVTKILTSPPPPPPEKKEEKKDGEKNGEKEKEN